MCKIGKKNNARPQHYLQTYKNANYHYLFYKDTYKLRTYIKYFREPAFGGEVSEAGIKKQKKTTEEMYGHYDDKNVVPELHHF